MPPSVVSIEKGISRDHLPYPMVSLSLGLGGEENPVLNTQEPTIQNEQMSAFGHVCFRYLKIKVAKHNR